jgi:hypothetical protein
MRFVTSSRRIPRKRMRSTPPRVFREKSLDLLEKKEVYFFVNAKEFGSVLKGRNLRTVASNE